MGDTVVLEVDSCESLGVCNALAEDLVDAFVSNEHPTYFKVEHLSVFDKRGEGISELVDFGVFSKHILRETHTLDREG